MSELLLCVTRGFRRTEGCLRLVRECKFHCLFRISSFCNVEYTSSKLSFLAPGVTWTISRQLTWWSALRGFLRSSVDVDGSWRTASIGTNRNTSTLTRDEFSEDRKLSCVTQASRYLEQLLGITAKEAGCHVDNYPDFAIIDPDDIPRNYKACRNAGFTETAIRQNPEILSYPRRIHEGKLRLIQRMNLADIDNTIPLFKLGISSLRSLSNKIKFESKANKGMNRITHLSEQLKRSPFTICQILAKHDFMHTIPLTKLSQVLKTMLDSHVTTDDILNDIWSFRYSPELVCDRLKRVTDAGVSPVKPWMIRCPEDALSKRIGKEFNRRSILGENGTVIDYLRERFECDDNTITKIISKNPKITQVSGPKMKRVIDFLIENGYTVQHIIRLPRILFHKLETMQERLIELEKYGHRPKSLLVFCQSKRQYTEYLSRIKSHSLINDTE